MSASIAMTFFHANNAQAMIEAEMDRNNIEVLALTPGEWLSVLQDNAKSNPAKAKAIEAAVAQTSFKQYWNTTLSPNLETPFVLPAGQLGSDLYNLAKTMNALGVVGTELYTKGNYLIFKGKPGLRNVLKGTRYLKTNPQVVHLHLGMKGLKHFAHGVTCYRCSVPLFFPKSALILENVGYEKEQVHGRADHWFHQAS